VAEAFPTAPPWAQMDTIDLAGTSENGQSDNPRPGSKTIKDVWDIGASASNFPDEPWEAEMSETVAHLVSAFAAVERLRKLTPSGQLTTASCELASQSICAALAALDERDLAILLGAGDERGTSPPELAGVLADGLPRAQSHDVRAPRRP
jgi:hypothetical protein